MFEDVYVVVDRKREIMDEFLSVFAEGFEPGSTYFEYPQYSSDVEYETDDLETFVAFLFQNESRTYSLYWNKKRAFEDGARVCNAMVFLNKDTTMTLGLSVHPDYPEEVGQKLSDYFNCEGYVLHSIMKPPLHGGELKAMIGD